MRSPSTAETKRPRAVLTAGRRVTWNRLAPFVFPAVRRSALRRRRALSVVPTAERAFAVQVVGGVKMRNVFRHSFVASVAALVLASGIAVGQNAPAGNQNRPAAGAAGAGQQSNVPGRKTAQDTGGPAPAHDLSGTWIGNGESRLMTHIPALTAAGEAKLKLNVPDPFSGTSNDPWQTCDPLGMPRVVNNEVRTIGFATMP